MAFFFKSIPVFMLCLLLVPSSSQLPILIQYNTAVPCLEYNVASIVVFPPVTVTPHTLRPGETFAIQFTAFRTKPVEDENVEVGTSLGYVTAIPPPVEEESFAHICGSDFGNCDPSKITGRLELQIPSWSPVARPWTVLIQFRNSVTKAIIGCATVIVWVN